MKEQKLTRLARELVEAWEASNPKEVKRLRKEGKLTGLAQRMADMAKDELADVQQDLMRMIPSEHDYHGELARQNQLASMAREIVLPSYLGALVDEGD